MFIKKRHEGKLVPNEFWTIESSDGGFVDGIFWTEEEADAAIEIASHPLSEDTRKAVWG